MIRHLTGPGCQKRGKRPSDVQATLDSHFKKARVLRSETSEIPAFTDSQFSSRLIKFILSANILFRTVESDEFRDLLQFCRPSIKLPGRTQLKSLIIDCANQVRQQILQELPKNRKLSIAGPVQTTSPSSQFWAISLLMTGNTRKSYSPFILFMENILGSR